MSSEEYLDSLLRSLEASTNEEPSPLVKKVFKDLDDRETQEMSSASDVTEEILPQLEPIAIPEEEMIPSGNDILMGFSEMDFGETEDAVGSMYEDADASVGFASEETDISVGSGDDELSDLAAFFETEGKTSLEDLFAAVDEDKLVAEAEMDSVISDDMDVTELIDSMSDLDDSLMEINDLLKKSDNNETIEADAEMLAFLDSYHAGEELSDLLGDDTSEEISKTADSPKEGTIITKVRNFFDRFKKRKKNESEELSAGQSVEETEPISEQVADQDDVESFLDSFALEKEEEILKKAPDNISEDEINSLFGNLGNDDSVDSGFAEEFAALFAQEEEPGEENSETSSETADSDDSAKKEKKEKKPGLIRRLIEALTAEDEEELIAGISENEEIMKELDAEDKGKKGKNKKDKKGKKGKSGKGDDDIDGEEAPEKKPEKKKKPKKEKKEKDPLEVEMNKGKKVLSKRGLITLIAFCASLVAIIVAFAFFITDYADKQKARQAFYVGDYQEAYVLLYDKTLSDSDAMILERVRLILELQRHIEVYEFYDKTDQQALALNALLEGVGKYEELAVVNHFGSGRELEDIYGDILALLQEKFGISEERAKEINSYNADQYTLTVYDIVNGGGNTGDDASAEDSGENAADSEESLEDVLPLEEELLNE